MERMMMPCQDCGIPIPDPGEDNTEKAAVLCDSCYAKDECATSGCQYGPDRRCQNCGSRQGAAVTAPALRGLSDDEHALLNHWAMFGSDGYPVNRVGSRHWSWSYRSIQGPPVVFPTKRQAVQSFEKFIDVLLDAKAGRL